MTSQPEILTSQDVEQLLRLLPKYRVLLYNDDENAMDFGCWWADANGGVPTVDEAIKMLAPMPIERDSAGGDLP